MIANSFSCLSLAFLFADVMQNCLIRHLIKSHRSRLSVRHKKTRQASNLFFRHFLGKFVIDIEKGRNKFPIASSKVFSGYAAKLNADGRMICVWSRLKTYVCNQIIQLVFLK